jgi:Exostosin family
MILKIFADRAYVPEGGRHVTMLYPFWGKNPEEPGEPMTGQFDRYVEVGGRFFEMTTLPQADLAVLPQPWQQVFEDETALARAQRFVEAADRANKRVVLFFWSDSDADVAYPQAVVFRTSLYRSRRRHNEFAMPSWSEDFVQRYLDGQLVVRTKHHRPVVGFCGHVPASNQNSRGLLRRLKRAAYADSKGLLYSLGLSPVAIASGTAADSAALQPGSSIRTTALSALERCHGVKTNFVIREHFFGGAAKAERTAEVARMQRVRQDYVRNMVGSDYIVCTRGAGNYSFRLYETLNCGRIPVFVDTDCMLPYDTAVPWKDYCVWVNEKDVAQIGERVLQFHESLSDRQFVELQRDCRMFWETHLSPEGFFEHLYMHFR